MISSYKGKLLTGIIVLITIVCFFYRDQFLEKGGTPDLRNRVVGARLQKDGISPYYYTWHNGDSIRYYGTSNFANGVSNISSSPFQHILFYSFAELPQRTISRVWLFVEYILLLITAALAYWLAQTNLQKIFVSITFILFLFTEAWKVHIYTGQTYIMMPFFAMVIYYCLSKRESLPAAFIAGLAAIMLVLVRPNAFLFFLPFLFLIPAYSRRYLTIFAIPIILISLACCTSTNQRLYWKEYLSAVQASIDAHQGLSPKKTAGVAEKKIKLKDLEGWDSAAINRVTQSDVFIRHSEHANFFVVYQNMFKERIPVNTMNLLSGCAVILLLLLFYFIGKKYSPVQLPNVAIFGFCLYMISDLSSPIWRHQYYTVQWLFPLLITASRYSPKNKWLYAGLLLALVLNIINVSWIKMEHTIGEYLILLILLYMGLTQKLAPKEELTL